MATTIPSNTFEDLSGVANGTYDNPYDALIESALHDPVRSVMHTVPMVVANNMLANIQARYNVHRTTRNSQQRMRLLDPEFPGVIVDPILQRIQDPSIEPGYADPRHCLVFWARPSQKVESLVLDVQQRLLTVLPSLWLMPHDCLHMTVLEVTHSRKAEAIQPLVEILRPGVSKIVNHTLGHRARLVKPLISYDTAAIALSFLPAAGEALHDGRTLDDDQYTYHHLRRDVYSLTKDTGVAVDSRYTVPSSHLTIARFITADDFAKNNHEGMEVTDNKKMKALVENIENINAWLEAEYWPQPDSSGLKDGGEWIVGEEQGLDCRQGRLWYGGGETVQRGRGF